MNDRGIPTASCAGGRRCRPRRAGMVAACLAALLAVLAQHLPPGGAAQPPRKVGVVDFYAPSPLEFFSGVIPERFAADDLADMLSRTTEAGLTVISRAEIRQAEAAVHWHYDDAVHFARLSALARAAGADRLIVGWISMLIVSVGGGGGVAGGDGVEPAGLASVVVQIFDASQGRIVAETQHRGYSTGTVRDLVVSQALHDALRPTVPWLTSNLAAQAP